MRLRSIQTAKAVWLFDLNLVNPRGLSYKPLLDAIKERYKFAKAPDSMLDRSQKTGLSFQQGQFVTPDGRDIYIGLEIYTDGMVASTSSSTNDSTVFLEDLASFALTKGFSWPEQIGRGFTSTVLVETKGNLLSINPQLQRISQFIESRLISKDGKPRRFQVAALNFWSEDLSKNFSPSPFKFERKIGENFEADIYYSEAPLQTDEHLALLEELENIIS